MRKESEREWDERRRKRDVVVELEEHRRSPMQLTITYQHVSRPS